MEFFDDHIHTFESLRLIVSPEYGQYSALISGPKNEVVGYQHRQPYPFNLAEKISTLPLVERIVRVNTPFTLIPSSQYDESLKHKLAKEAFTFDALDFIDTFTIHDLTCIYLIDKSLRSQIVKEFDNFQIEHVLESLLRNYLADEKTIVTHWVDGHVIIIAMHSGLKLANRYAIQVPEDAIYYVLAAYQHANLNPHVTPLTISGMLTESSTYFEKLSGFVKHFVWPGQDPLRTESANFEPHLYHHLL